MNKKRIAEFFNSLADGWDASLSPNAEKMAVILHAAKIESGDSVLDIACGTGVMFDFLLGKNVVSITGVDISAKMLRVAESKYKNDSRIRLLCADAEEYPFNEKYDRCIIFNAFPHFPNPERLIDNLKRALKVGGTLTVAHDNGRAALDAHHRAQAEEVSLGLISETELKLMLEAHGFTDIYTLATDDIYIVSGRLK